MELFRDFLVSIDRGFEEKLITVLQWWDTGEISVVLLFGVLGFHTGGL